MATSWLGGEDPAKPGPDRGSASASAPGYPGLRTGTNGRPSSVVAPPPMEPIAPPGGNFPSFASGVKASTPGIGGQGRPAPKPAQSAAPAPGQAPAPTGRVPLPHEAGLIPPGLAVETPIGTYTQTPQGPMVVLNEAGQAAYQQRMSKFYEAYKTSMPPEAADLDLPLPQVKVGQKFFNPWTNTWLTV